MTTHSLRSVSIFVSLAMTAIASLGCSGCSGDRPDAQTASSSGANGSSGAAPPVQGPLAALESAPFMNEVWRTDDGQNAAFILYTRENVRVSASCRAASGALTCEAIRYLRGGNPVEIPRSALDGRSSAGVKVCRQLGRPIVTGHSPSGSEDSFCQFADGSLLATGSLEQYGMRVKD